VNSVHKRFAYTKSSSALSNYTVGSSMELICSRLIALSYCRRIRARSLSSRVVLKRLIWVYTSARLRTMFPRS